MYLKSIKSILLSILLFAFAPLSNAQSDSLFHFLYSIKGGFNSFNVDNLDNIYLITKENQLKKINGNRDSIGVFNDVKRFGNPSSLDVSNPLKILLYYRDFSTVVVLDRFLNIRNTINLREQKMFIVNTIAASYDNNIWLFDEEDYKLKKIDEGGQVLQETTGWRILFDSVPSPIQLLDRQNDVYLYDKDKGFYIFDYYGVFKNRLPFLNWSNVEVSGKFIYGFSNDKLYMYELHSLQLKDYELPSFLKRYRDLKVINGKLYQLTDDGLAIYQLK